MILFYLYLYISLFTAFYCFLKLIFINIIIIQCYIFNIIFLNNIEL